MNLKQTILNADDTRLEPVEVPEWKATVYVPVTTIAEAERLQGMTKGSDSFARMAANIILDEDGKRVFDDGDIPALSKKSLAALSRVLDRYNAINGNKAGGENDPKS
jgi:hypothetical protein